MHSRGAFTDLKEGITLGSPLNLLNPVSQFCLFRCPLLLRLLPAGEVHLETCIKDLKERFARVELIVSPPLVAFRCVCVCVGGVGCGVGGWGGGLSD